METVYTIIYGLLALGIIVLVHELGHFLLAKYFGVRVEIFSLGMGPGIIKYKKGDTLYQIGPIPFGGFCKMAGEEPGDKLTGDSGELYSKPPAQRLGIIFAGPFFNYVFGVLLFIVLMNIGIDKPTFNNKIIVPDKMYKEEISSAAKAGLKSGDWIINIDGRDVTGWKPIQKLIIELKNKKEKSLTVKRTLFTIINKEFNKTVKLKINSIADPYTGESLIRPYNEKNKNNQISVAEYVYKPFDSPAKKAGLKDHDEIIKIDEEDILNFQMILEKISTSGDKKEKRITIKRNNKIKNFNIKPIINPNTGQSRIGINPDISSHLTTQIDSLLKGFPAQKGGLKINDRIIKINNKKIISNNDIKKYISNMPGKLLTIYVKRDNNIKSFRVKTTNIEGKGMIGAGFHLDNKQYVVKSKNFFISIGDGFNQANEKIKQVFYSLKLMISGKVNAKKAIAGPIGIVHIMGKMTNEGGILMFIYIIAIISVMLGVFNLLPIPAIDGSYILIFSFELIFRKKPNYKVIQIVQYVFFLILMGLILLVSINDISRLIKKGVDTGGVLSISIS